MFWIKINRDKTLFLGQDNMKLKKILAGENQSHFQEDLERNWTWSYLGYKEKRKKKRSWDAVNCRISAS